MDVLVAAEVVSRLRYWSAGILPAGFRKMTQLAGTMPALPSLYLNAVSSTDSRNAEIIFCNCAWVVQ